MYFVPVDPYIDQHPKIRSLMLRLGMTDIEVWPRVVNIHRWAFKTSRNGYVTVMSRDPYLLADVLRIPEIEKAKAFFQAMIDVQLLDSGEEISIHDWFKDGAGKYFVALENASERQKRFRDKGKSNSYVTVTDAENKGSSPLRNGRTKETKETKELIAVAENGDGEELPLGISKTDAAEQAKIIVDYYVQKIGNHDGKADGLRHIQKRLRGVRVMGQPKDINYPPVSMSDILKWLDNVVIDFETNKLSKNEEIARHFTPRLNTLFGQQFKLYAEYQHGPKINREISEAQKPKFSAPIEAFARKLASKWPAFMGYAAQGVEKNRVEITKLLGERDYDAALYMAKKGGVNICNSSPQPFLVKAICEVMAGFEEKVDE